MKKLDMESYTEIDSELMSNFDHVICQGAEELLRAGKVYAGYPGLNFYGIVWHEDGKFYCEIWQYHRHINTISGNSLQEIMNTASEYYGSD